MPLNVHIHHHHIRDEAPQGVEHKLSLVLAKLEQIMAAIDDELASVKASLDYDPDWRNRVACGNRRNACGGADACAAGCA